VVFATLQLLTIYPKLQFKLRSYATNIGDVSTIKAGQAEISRDNTIHTIGAD
jgi:hypothetical protein